MSLPVAASRPCYSMRLLRPFLKLLREHPATPAGLLDSLQAMDADERVPADTVHELLRGAVALTSDEDLGLRAARELELGELGALEYVAASAASMREAMAVLGRYMQLVNDALAFSVRVADGRAFVVMDNSVVLPRAAEDFEVAALYVAAQRRLGPVARPPHAVHFKHEAPASMEEYDATFGSSARVHFGQGFTGFTLELSALDLQMPTRDSALHAVLREHAETLLLELPAVESFTTRVRELVVRELSGGDPSVTRIAKLLHMSPRTLARRLEDEHTTFKVLLDDLRKGLGLRYAVKSDLQLSEIALLLGFSSAPAFHRAFKRWTGVSPIDYRKSQRG